MPLQKSADGSFLGILSDNSIDRDNEFMTKDLLQSWVADGRPLPMLANHENKLEKLIGGWTDKKLLEKGDSAAMLAKPFFLESNPLGKQAKAMVEEALDKGLGIGISIGAIPKGDMVSKEVDGKTFKGYTEAEILEATIVPIQSNRNASFTAMAKSFNIDTEVTKMTEEEPKVEAPAEPAPEAPKEEPKEEAAPAEEAPKEAAVNPEIKKLKEEVKKLKEQAVLKAKVDGPIEVAKEVEPTFTNLLKMKFGGQ